MRILLNIAESQKKGETYNFSNFMLQEVELKELPIIETLFECVDSSTNKMFLNSDSISHSFLKDILGLFKHLLKVEDQDFSIYLASKGAMQVFSSVYFKNQEWVSKSFGDVQVHHQFCHVIETLCLLSLIHI